MRTIDRNLTALLLTAPGMRLAREKQVNVRVIPTGAAIHESVDLAYELYNCVFRRVPRSLREKKGLADLDVRGTE